MLDLTEGVLGAIQAFFVRGGPVARRGNSSRPGAGANGSF